MYRSTRWYAGTDRNARIHRAWMRPGIPSRTFDGRPHIALAHTASYLTRGSAHLDEVAEHVKRDVREAGGIPLNRPAASMSETPARPMVTPWRNMAARAIEQMLRGKPIESGVVLSGCDDGIPAQLMAAAPVVLPAALAPGRPTLTGRFRGVPLGYGIDMWNLEEGRAGALIETSFLRSASVIPSMVHFNMVGTASTTNPLPKMLDMILHGLVGAPVSDSRFLEAAHRVGRPAWEVAAAGRHPSAMLGRASFSNAIVAVGVCGDSNSAALHLPTTAGRLCVQLTLDDFERIDSDVPSVVDLQHDADIADAEQQPRCSDGAVIKPTAAPPHLLIPRDCSCTGGSTSASPAGTGGPRSGLARRTWLRPPDTQLAAPVHRHGPAGQHRRRPGLPRRFQR